MWWKADFGGDFNIQLVKIRTRRDCCGGRLAGVKVFIGNTQCGQVQNGTKNGKWYKVRCNARGGFVKLMTSTNEYLSISGIKVYTSDRRGGRSGGSRSGNRYRPRLVNAEQGSNYRNDKYLASNAIDGSGKFTHTKKGVGQWWSVNFAGGEHYITNVRVRNRRDCCGARLSNVKIMVGN
jgi:hypothetical protein